MDDSVVTGPDWTIWVALFVVALVATIVLGVGIAELWIRFKSWRAYRRRRRTLADQLTKDMETIAARTVGPDTVYRPLRVTKDSDDDAEQSE